jgi:hypothetical protein
MQIIEPLNDCVADLYWLAFLITGHSGLSVDVTLEALDFQEGANSSSSTCMLPSLRRVLIAKALGAIPDELVASRRRTSSTRAKKAKLPTWNWTLDRGTTKSHVESALLAIDVFPRCALLLLIFERLSLEDAAMLLEGDRDLVRKGQMIGLRELTSNLARMQKWTNGSRTSPRAPVEIGCPAVSLFKSSGPD